MTKPMAELMAKTDGRADGRTDEGQLKTNRTHPAPLNFGLRWMVLAYPMCILNAMQCNLVQLTFDVVQQTFKVQCSIFDVRCLMLCGRCKMFGIQRNVPWRKLSPPLARSGTLWFFPPAATMIASSCFQILFGLAVDPGLVTWSDAKASCVATQVFS